MYDLTVIIPTYNEELTIASIIKKLQILFSLNHIEGEILIVDDNSPDGTVTEIQKLQRYMQNLHLVIRKRDPGLSQSVVEGFRQAQSDIFVVTDADESHDLSLIPKMYSAIKSGTDIVNGSRYMEGGGID